MTPAEQYSRFQDLQRYVGWTDNDARNVKSLIGLLAPNLPGLVDDFYDELERHPASRKVVTGGPAQIVRLKITLSEWLRELLAGPYDEQYVERRWRVGWRHVEIGLDQVYTNAALARLRRGLLRIIDREWRGDPRECHAVIESLNTLLDLDLAIIEDAYQSEYLARQQRAERLQALGQVGAANEAREKALAELQAKTEELRATTQQLWQSARLAGVGELAASIAHELNNPLGTVSLRVEGILAKTPQDDPRRAALEVIDQEVERMAALVANLLQFSRAGRDQVSTVDVREEVTKTIELTGHHMRKYAIRVESDFDPDVPVVFADRQHLRQVFLNLITNAADAMPGGGRLVLRVRTGKMPDGRPAVLIEVVDTGVGIPPEHLHRVTDPFFTTKPEGKGTGLGLAICRRIVQQHQGALHVDSVVGIGTTVRVVLPVRPDANVAVLHTD